MTWLPINTAPGDGTEILASDWNGIEIVSWYIEQVEPITSGERINPQRMAMYPVWWQPLPEHPPLPEVE